MSSVVCRCEPCVITELCQEREDQLHLELNIDQLCGEIKFVLKVTIDLLEYYVKMFKFHWRDSTLTQMVLLSSLYPPRGSRRPISVPSSPAS